MALNAYYGIAKQNCTVIVKYSNPKEYQMDASKFNAETSSDVSIEFDDLTFRIKFTISLSDQSQIPQKLSALLELR